MVSSRFGSVACAQCDSFFWLLLFNGDVDETRRRGAGSGAGAGAGSGAQAQGQGLWCSRLFGYMSVYRISLTFCALHVALCVLCVRVKNSRSWRGALHHGHVTSHDSRRAASRRTLNTRAQTILTPAQLTPAQRTRRVYSTAEYSRESIYEYCNCMKLYGTTVSLPVNMNVNVLLGSVLCSYWSVKLGVVILVLVAVLLLPMRSVPLIRDGTPLPSTSPSSPLRLLYCTLSTVNTTLHYSTVLPSSSPLFCSARRGAAQTGALQLIAHCPATSQH